jgi:hypothetical protein
VVFLDFTAFDIRQTVEEKLAALDWSAKTTGARP